MSDLGHSATAAGHALLSVEEWILLQNDFERSATKFLIQGLNGQRKIDSSGGHLGFDCCVLDECRRLLQHNRMGKRTSDRAASMSRKCAISRHPDLGST
jgi:hypothetical protein